MILNGKPTHFPKRTNSTPGFLRRYIRYCAKAAGKPNASLTSVCRVCRDGHTREAIIWLGLLFLL
ncbi:hypothetical protein DPMN_177488 [Dreissena polymorpha]|uniref:Uncharacterized protein n=1 Tax=Dreissena polymorpha TaxID=45954 RepID=A0A9D4IJ21_DREPO|nr:hypothetical protein DPMN_177488 [Dreissena polymorpha]